MAVRPLLAAVDLVLALVVFVLTADQGSGMKEFGVFGGLPEPAQTLIAAGVALPVLLRRRNPYPLLLAGAAVWAVMAAPWALMVATYTLSARSARPRWFGVLAGVVALLVFLRLLLGSDASVSYVTLLTVLVAATPVLLGLWIGARRALVENLRERAERLERERHLESERAKAQERTRIARELHDVVAHRVSLMVLHAGALQLSLADGEAEQAEQAELIRQTGREALEELRQVLGVLREPDGRALLGPEPTLADLDGVVRRSREASIQVSLAVEGERRPLPGAVERTAYRLVQEALTNVGKHAGNAPTEVRLDYGPERLEVTVRNRRPATPPAAGLALPGGHGLLGLRERVALLGGTFHAGPCLDGGFEVRASIPTAVAV